MSGYVVRCEMRSHTLGIESPLGNIAIDDMVCVKHDCRQVKEPFFVTWKNKDNEEFTVSGTTLAEAVLKYFAKRFTQGDCLKTKER